jgi:ElaB/YqjD/DUF883 family membrane-anchored ribosome-binding protein
MTQDSAQIRAQIEETRYALSTDVNTLADTARPGNIARRQVGRVRGTAGRARDRVMGSAPDLGQARDSVSSSASSALDSARSSVSDAASTTGDAISGAPEQIRQQTQGNPLAAGLIAFGVGWLASALIPASEPEQRAAAAVKDNLEPVQQKITDAGRTVAENLREPAQQAVESVKQTAQDAAQRTKQEGVDAAQQVKGDAQEGVSNVQQSR